MRAGIHERLHRQTPFWNSDSLLSYETCTKELHLTPEQGRKLKMILDDYARYHQDLQAQLDDWRATGKNQILQLLDPGQRERFKELTRER